MTNLSAENDQRLRKTLCKTRGIENPVIVKKAEIGYAEIMKGWALVTGAAVRTGRECARYLADYGYGLILHYRQSKKEAENLSGELSGKGVPVKMICCDFVREDAVECLWQAVSVPGLKVIVNNAAVFIPDTPLTADAQTVDRQIRINYEVPFELMCRTEKNFCGCTLINFLDGRLESSAENFYSYGLSKKMIEWATVCFGKRSKVNRYYGIAPRALLPPVIDGAPPAAGQSYRISGTEVLKPVFDRILCGDVPGGTVFSV